MERPFLGRMIKQGLAVMLETIRVLKEQNIPAWDDSIYYYSW